MPGKKAFLLRLDPAVWSLLERVARTELRSVNGQIEFLLRDALTRRSAAARERPAQRGATRKGARRG
jgi:hypothetical protein